LVAAYGQIRMAADRFLVSHGLGVRAPL